jgi:adenine-specific DNA-methyltransferase
MMNLARTELAELAEFKANTLFDLKEAPEAADIALGTYNLDWREADKKDQHFFAETSPLASWIINEAIKQELGEGLLLELDYKSYPFKISALEPYINKSGWITAEKITISSIEDEDFLLLTAITSEGELLDLDLANKLIMVPCSNLSKGAKNIPAIELDEAAAKHREVVTKQIDERNAQYFDEETGKLDSWADDLKFGLETEIKQLDKDIKEAKKAASSAMSLASKLEHQKHLRDLEQVRNAKRRSLYEAQDKIDEQRDTLIKKVEKQLKCTVTNTKLCTVQWSLK